ncbi:MAG: lipocalin family protein [Bacteroidales bacterium]
MLFTVSCEKLSDEELLTNHIWKYKEMTTTSTDPNIISIVTFVNALMVNATMDFNEDGTYTLSAMGQTTTGTWELSEDGKTLITETSGGEEDVLTVVKLTKDNLTLQGQEVDNTYGAYSVTIYWIK